MGLRINTNLPSINAQRHLGGSQRALNNAYQQLSSGSRINKAADDAAGLAVSERFRAQIRSYSQAKRNAEDGSSLVQVAEGGLSEINNILVRMRELAIQASSDTIGNEERGFIDLEIQQLKDEVERISQTTAFGSRNLLNGEGGQFDFQVGVGNDAFKDRISFDATQLDATASTLAVDGLDFSSKEGAQGALEVLDMAQNKVAGVRAVLGAMQNRLTSTQENLDVASENIQAANSRIRDADVAHASAELAKHSMLLSASTSVLGQANATPAMAMKLFS